MKVRELLESIENWKREYPDLLDYDVYTEQVNTQDREYKERYQKWEIESDSDGWEYFKCHGFNTVFSDKKIFTINVNY